MTSVLFRFMLIFEINQFHILETTESKIRARVGWENDAEIDFGDDDGEMQEIEWEIQKFDNLLDALTLSELILDNDLIDIDKITAPPDVLRRLTGWSSDKFERTIKTLLEFRVDMIDDGKKSDYFFVHF